MTCFKGSLSNSGRENQYSAQYTPYSLMEINNKKMLPLIAAHLYIEENMNLLSQLASYFIKLNQGSSPN
jgi:hypothetical protein